MSQEILIGANFVAIAVLVFGIYFPRHRRRDMVVAYLGVNAGVLAIAAILSSVNATVGLGLGLFGMLSIIRLRSVELDQQEVAYYFVALALGLIAGFTPDPAWVAPALGTMLLAVMYVVDHPSLNRDHRRQVVRLDTAYTDEAKLVARLEELLGGEARVVAGFHHIAAHELSAGDHPIECDLLICGTDAEGKKLVSELGRSMGLRPVDVGALSNAGPIEGITALLATINRRYKLKNSGIQITGLP